MPRLTELGPELSFAAWQAEVFGIGLSKLVEAGASLRNADFEDAQTLEICGRIDKIIDDAHSHHAALCQKALDAEKAVREAWREDVEVKGAPYTLYYQAHGDYACSGTLRDDDAELGKRNLASNCIFSLEALIYWAVDEAATRGGHLAKVTDEPIGLDVSAIVTAEGVLA